jgi:hypothetical protein
MSSPPRNVVHPTCVACRAKVSGGTKVGFRLAYTASKGRDSVVGRGGGNGGTELLEPKKKGDGQQVRETCMRKDS